MRRALAFLTPVGGAAVPTPNALAWFPAAGATIGLVVGAVWWGANEVWTPALAAALAVAADLALTGLLHVDGLADAADGLLPHLDRERRLGVMAEPDVGAFGVATVGAVLLLRFAALAARPPSVLLLAGLWCASRTTMAAAARSVPYARDEGLATAFLDRRARARGIAAGGLVLALTLAAGGAGWAGVAGVGGVIAGGAAVVGLAVRRIGGFTGDVLGAAGVVGETCGLVLAAARW